MWNGLSIIARQRKSVPSTLKTLGFTVPTQVRVHMVSPVGGTEFQKGKNMAEKVTGLTETPVDDAKVLLEERISKLEEDLYQRFSFPVEESGNGKIQSQITNPLDAKISLEEKLSKLVKEFCELEEELGKLDATEGKHLETWGSDHEYGRKKMELLARVETLYNEAKSYEFSTQSGWENFLVSDILLRFEFQLKKRSSSDPKITDTLGHIPLDHSPQNPNLLDSLKQEYLQDVEVMASGSPSPEAVKFFDVVELLSRFPGDLIRNDGNRSRVALNRDTFKGKYVLICCFHVPVIPFSDFPFLVRLCNELYSTRDDFEMVVVARMNSLADGEEVFHHFLSGFPKSCLAIPFKDSKRRDYICKVLNLSHHCNFQCLLLNAEGIAVGNVLPSMNRDIFSEYGAEGFPFTDDILYKRDLERKDMIFDKEGNWLERVLRCNDSSPDFVYKVNPAGGPREEMSISQLSNKLKNKHVGLYLWKGRKISRELIGMYEICREKQLHFEVVVVCMPFGCKIDPKIYQEKIYSMLKKHNICDWWCLPFNNSVSMRFWHLSKAYYDREGFGEEAACDNLIVVGPDVNHLDMYGFNVMCHQGIDAFPFTIEAGIKQRENELKQITLESLFADGDVSVFRGNNSSDSKKLGQLFQGKKNIILCIDSLSSGSDFKTLASVYNQTKTVEKDDFEMVFVVRPDLANEDEDESMEIHEMPWYICPMNGTNSKMLEELIRLVGQCPDVLVGFGEDGRVCSCRTTLEVTVEANEASDDECDSASQQFSLVDSLYRDVECLLGYDELGDYDMEVFANPRVRK